RPGRGGGLPRGPLPLERGRGEARHCRGVARRLHAVLPARPAGLAPPVAAVLLPRRRPAPRLARGARVEAVAVNRGSQMSAGRLYPGGGPLPCPGGARGLIARPTRLTFAVLRAGRNRGGVAREGARV